MKIIKEPEFKVGKKGRFILTTPLVYFDHRLEKNIKIPKGFVTDFASIPRGFRWLIPINGNHRLPAIVHDFIYQRGGNIDGEKLYQRHQADELFYDLMIQYSVSWWRRKSMFRAVRIGGGFSWND